MTIVEALPPLVPLEDEFASKLLERAFRRRKIAFKTGVKFSGVKQTDDSVTVSLESGEDIEADLLLVAVGRGPNTAGRGYEEAGITMERGFVLTDERLHTNLRQRLRRGRHRARAAARAPRLPQGIFVAEEIAGLNPPMIDEAGIPRVTYCEPEVASVGLTEAQAKEQYGEVADADLRPGRQRQVADPEDPGRVKLVAASRDAARWSGMHMVGARVGELIGEAQLVYNWEAYAEDVAALIHAHPTQNEAFGEANLALAGKPLHAHG